MLKQPLKLCEQWQKARAKQPISPAAEANTQTSIHTTESWRVQVILSISQAGNGNIHLMSAVRSRSHLGELTVNPNSSKYQPSSPSWFCFAWPGTNSLLTSHMAQLQHRNHPWTTQKPHRHRAAHLYGIQSCAAIDKILLQRKTLVWTYLWLCLVGVLEGQIKPTHFQHFLHDLRLTW